MIKRLPNPGSSWVWDFDNPPLMELIKVTRVEFTGETWVITTETFPQIGLPTIKDVHLIEYFWDKVVPISGRIEDLSTELDEDQYKRNRVA